MFKIKKASFLLIPLLAGSMLTSCVSKKKYNEVVDARDRYKMEYLDTQNELATLESRVELMGLSVEEEQELRKLLEQRNASLVYNMNMVENFMNKILNRVAEVEQELNAEFAGQEQDIQVYVEEGDIHLGLSDMMLFNTGSSELRPAGRIAIAKLAKVMKGHPEMNITVEGHTDSRQYPENSDMDNWELSTARANTVVRTLIDKGVEPDQLRSAGVSSTEPMVENPSDNSRVLNRRTEIILEANFQPLFRQFSSEVESVMVSPK